MLHHHPGASGCLTTLHCSTTKHLSNWLIYCIAKSKCQWAIFLNWWKSLLNGLEEDLIPTSNCLLLMWKTCMQPSMPAHWGMYHGSPSQFHTAGVQMKEILHGSKHLLTFGSMTLTLSWNISLQTVTSQEKWISVQRKYGIRRQKYGTIRTLCWAIGLGVKQYAPFFFSLEWLTDV